jgi:drug/metabolite transporter (DMT)-like permease
VPCFAQAYGCGVVKPRVNGIAVIAVSSLFFGLMAVLTRLLAGQVPATQVATVRFAVGVVGCGFLFLAQRRLPQLTQWRLLGVRGITGGIAVVTYFFAIERLGAASATVLNYSSPIYAAAFAAWFLGETSTPLRRLGLVVATSGAVVVALSTGSVENPFVPDLGAVAGVISAIAGGASMTAIRRLRNDTDALTVFFAFCVVGVLVSFPLAAPGWVPLSGNALLICLAVGVLSIAGQLLFTYGMGFTTATAGSATTQLVPAVAWTLALGWLGEPVTALGVLGAVLCVSGVLLGVLPWTDWVARTKRATNLG